MASGSKEWWYSVAEVRKGPVSTSELRQLAADGKLSPTDLIWKEGMAKWVPAKSARGLFAEGSRPTPPPVPKSAPSAPRDEPISSASGIAPAASAPPSTMSSGVKRRVLLWAASVIVSLLVGLGFLYYGWNLIRTQVGGSLPALISPGSPSSINAAVEKIEAAYKGRDHKAFLEASMALIRAFRDLGDSVGQLKNSGKIDSHEYLVTAGDVMQDPRYKGGLEGDDANAFVFANHDAFVLLELSKANGGEDAIDAFIRVRLLDLQPAFKKFEQEAMNRFPDLATRIRRGKVD